MADINLSIPQFIFIPFENKETERFTLINLVHILEVNDDGEHIKIKLINGSSRIFSEQERTIIIQQLMLYQVNNNKNLPKQ